MQEEEGIWLHLALSLAEDTKTCVMCCDEGALPGCPPICIPAVLGLVPGTRCSCPAAVGDEEPR